MNKQLEILQGTLDMLILKAVSLGPLHGYGFVATVGVARNPRRGGYSVEQRRHELRIRLALGAELKGLMAMIIRQSMRPVVTGLAVGIVAGVFAGRLISSLLFGVEAYDALTLTVVAVVVTMVGLTACYVPARRASRVEPMVALRFE